MKMNVKRNTRPTPVKALIPTLVCLLILVLAGCNQKDTATPQPKLNFATEYQAIFLDNGQTFFGKIENAGSPYPLLKDVFYIQTQINKDTNERRSMLIKRGSEWHAPDSMYLNAQHIVLIEPVGNNSKVAQLIAEAKSGKTETTPPSTSTTGSRGNAQ